MTDLNFMPVSRMPVMSIPDVGAEEYQNSLRFKIVTARGVIGVSGRNHSWHCAGSAEALAMAGLLELAWLPGIEGNNKVSQTVCFDSGGPELYLGNPRGRQLADSIQIKRLSAKLFEVTIPATPEQAPILEALGRKYFQRLVDERDRKSLVAAIEEQKERALNSTPDDVRAAIAFNFECFCQFVHFRSQESGFQFDAASARAIDDHLAALRAAFNSAVVCRAPSEFTGNVVPFVRGA